MQTLKLLDVHEVADCLGVSVTTVKRLVRSGEITPLRVGVRLVRFSPDAIRDYLDRASTPMSA